MATRRKALKSLVSIPFIGGVLSSNELLSYQNGNIVKLNRDYFKELGIRTFINAAWYSSSIYNILERKNKASSFKVYCFYHH